MVSILTATFNTKFTALCLDKLDLFLCSVFFFTIYNNYFSVQNSDLVFLLEADWATEY